MQAMTQAESYDFNRANMIDRFVIFDGEVHQVRGVFLGSTGLRYTLVDSNGRFYVGFPDTLPSGMGREKQKNFQFCSRLLTIEISNVYLRQ